jgi:hypothetical protein
MSQRAERVEWADAQQQSNQGCLTHQLGDLANDSFDCVCFAAKQYRAWPAVNCFDLFAPVSSCIKSVDLVCSRVLVVGGYNDS